MSKELNRRVELLAIMLALAAGMWLWASWGDIAREIEEGPAPAVIQSDASLVLARAPESAVPAASRPIASATPRGAKVERRARIVVRPKTLGSDVRTDIAVVRNTDGTRRIVASSPDGNVVGGIDIPMERFKMPPDRRWAAGLSLDTERNRPGIWVERDIGRVRLGVELMRSEVRLKAGITF